MRILWHSVAPHAKTGYGQQTAIWIPRLASLGHDIAISAFSGVWGGVLEWRGHRIYPSGAHPYGGDVIAMNAAHWDADLVITLMDFWALGEDAPLKGMPLAAWMPLDHWPLNAKDKLMVPESGAVPIAMSHFGEQVLRDEGLDPLYVPHGIDTNLFHPAVDRKGLRQAMGIDDYFVIGINAANNDMANRKGWLEQMTAFSRLYRKHKDVLLVIHSAARQSGALDLDFMAEDFGIKPAVRFSSQYLLLQGMITAEDMAGTYMSWDLISGCSFAEGFGLPLVEAQACGVPAVATKGSAMQETCGGWLVEGEDQYIPGHRAWWVRPNVHAIARVYETAYAKGPVYHAKQAQAREHALQFNADKVLKDYWVPCLEELRKRVSRP